MFTSELLAARCQGDPEFGLAARYWTGGIRLVGAGQVACVCLNNGTIEPAEVAESDPGVITLTGPAALWERLLAATPDRFANDIGFAQTLGLVRGGDELTYWQYYPAVARAIELLRPASTATAPTPKTTKPTKTPKASFDSPVGRYVHLELDGHDHRVYFEEAGQGIPLLLQHTAGSNGLQWRHLFEETRITDHFRLIAYDLPFHGKSVPPTTKAWWAERYRLTRDSAMAVPLALSAALELDRPVFMGCSVGGLLALDLARFHPESFRAVIALEGALNVGGNVERLQGFWHPQVSNDYKARLMNGIMAPQSPEPYRRETTYVYSAGWPQSFIGDLNYYIADHDLRGDTDSIDTNTVGVHLLTGEYDTSATVELSQEAHDAIPGSTFEVMAGMGHFPMSENPELFVTHLLPVLDQIRQR